MVEEEEEEQEERREADGIKLIADAEMDVRQRKNVTQPEKRSERM